jgi:LPXTG-site transpeptidase (sortase) family protein
MKIVITNHTEKFNKNYMVSKQTILFFEKGCLAVGSCLLLLFFVVKIHAYQGNNNAVNQVEEAILAASISSTTELDSRTIEDGHVTTEIDGHSLTHETDYWSAHRKERYREELVTSELLGILEIPQIDVKVAIFDKATETHLNKGVARVLGTSSLAGEGNLSIAGHRDSFFRNLGQLVVGDEMKVNDMKGNTFTYQVVKSWIVKPTDTHVLNKTENSSITLITCYPFYFVGSAPERYILRAERV